LRAYKETMMHAEGKIDSLASSIGQIIDRK